MLAYFCNSTNNALSMFERISVTCLRVDVLLCLVALCDSRGREECRSSWRSALSTPPPAAAAAASATGAETDAFTAAATRRPQSVADRARGRASARQPALADQRIRSRRVCIQTVSDSGRHRSLSSELTKIHPRIRLPRYYQADRAGRRLSCLSAHAAQRSKRLRTCLFVFVLSNFLEAIVFF